MGELTELPHKLEDLFKLFLPDVESILEKLDELENDRKQYTTQLRLKLSILQCEKHDELSHYFWREHLKADLGEKIVSTENSIKHFRRLLALAVGKPENGGPLSPERIEEARQVPIPHIVSDIQFRKRGRLLVSLCPLHSEKTPSFTVYPENRFHCFGCGQSGDVIDLVMEVQGLSFKEAISFLLGGGQ